MRENTAHLKQITSIGCTVVICKLSFTLSTTWGVEKLTAETINLVSIHDDLPQAVTLIGHLATKFIWNYR